MLTTATWVYLALGICCAGLVWKLWCWFSWEVGPAQEGVGPAARAAASIGAMIRALFSPKIGPIIKAFVLDGLIQRRVWRHSRLAWLAHMLIFWGFVLLVLMHALGEQITAAIWPDYSPTLNPYLFLRNLFGAMVLVGAILAVVRRSRPGQMRAVTRGIDIFALVLVGVIILSGFCLEGLKMTSYKSFARMAEEYAPSDEPADINALKAWWMVHYGVVFPEDQRPVLNQKIIEQGHQLDADSCVECHSSPRWAFLSYPLSRLLAPVSVGLVKGGGENALYYIHFFACLLGLALLPWTKFLHLITSPLVMTINAVAERDKMSPAVLASLQALELDACTHCATCTVHCSVGIAIKKVPNQLLLPSEKLLGMRKMGRLAKTQDQALAMLREGADICTMCYRCTQLCPVGINLQELWNSLKARLEALGWAPTTRAVAEEAAEQAAKERKEEIVFNPEFRKSLKASAQGRTFSHCFQCITCSNSCPVVKAYEDPKAELDMLPHQLMRAVALGMKHEAMGARMVWSCLTCYMCQEACPQGVRVTDVILELRSLAAQAILPERRG